MVNEILFFGIFGREDKCMWDNFYFNKNFGKLEMIVNGMEIFWKSF